MGCGDGMSKCFLITFGMFFLMFGGGCVAGGIYVLVAKNDILILARSATEDVVDIDSLDAPSLLEKTAYILIATGAFIVIISFLGCCGACLKNKCLLRTYVGIISLMILMEIAAGVLLFLYKDKLETYAKDNLQSMLDNNYIGPYSTSNAISLAFDLAQIMFKCCGVINGTDFASISTWNKTYAYQSGGSYVTATAVIPLTCCEFSNTDAFPDDMTTFLNSMVDNQCPVTQASSHTQGCYEKLKDEFMKYFYIMVGICGGIVGLQILGFMSACCLMKTDEKRKEVI